MEIRQLKYFAKVVETGSFSRAAEMLYIAQPAISAQIAQLEEELGCQLLSRSSRGVQATAAGLEFHRRALVALKHLDALRLVGTEQADQAQGSVVIGIPASVGTILSVPLVRLIQQRHPLVRLNLVESASAYIGDMLLQGRLDVAVLFEDAALRGVSSQRVLQEDLFLIGSPLQDASVSLTALDGLDMVMPSQPNSIRTLLDRACAASGVRPNMVAEVSSPTVMLQMARAGLAATVLPWSVVGGMEVRDDLPLTRLADASLQRHLCVAFASDAPQTPALLGVRAALVETMQALVQRGEWKEARLA